MPATKKQPSKKTAVKAAPKQATPKKKATASMSSKATTKPKASAKSAPKASAKSAPKASAKSAPKASAKSAPKASAKAVPRSASRSAAAAQNLANNGFRNYTPYQVRKGEDYMSDAMKAHFRAILGEWKRELMEEVDRTMHYMQDEAANFPDPNDRASQESDFTLELRARDRERKLIKKIDEALARLDADEYGDCESCGVEIGVRRLEARPTATLCIDCKTLDEIREKQLGE